MKRWHWLLVVWTLPSAVFLLITAIVYRGYRIDPPDRLDESERAAVIAPLRAALDRKPVTPSTVKPGPVVVTVWVEGRVLQRVDASSVDEAAKTIAEKNHDPNMASRARIQVDVIVGKSVLGEGHWLGQYSLPFVTGMMAVNPGIEGIGAEVGGKRALILPHELVAAKLLSTKRPSDTLDFAMGVDLNRIAKLVGARLGGIAVPVESLYRFRTDTFVEYESRTVQLTRGIPPPPKLSAATLREAALMGGRYLVAHLSPSGRYIYEHDLSTGMRTNPQSGPYSMPRHAGTTYFLAELYRITKEPWLREPIERAFAHLAELLSSGRCAGTTPTGEAFDCVLDRNEVVAHLGSTALTVVALAEYQRATGDTRYLPLATKFATFLLYMQRPDGSFRHLYDADKKQYDDK